MSQLSDALKNKLIPWSHQNSAGRFVVAREKMIVAQMPDGVTLVRRKVAGPRVIVKNRRYYGNTRGIKAYWPEAKLGELELHKLICVLDGRIDIQLGGYGIQCGEGFCLIIPPGTLESMDGHIHAKEELCQTLSIILHPHAIQCFITYDDKWQDRSRMRENYLFKNENLVLLFRIMMQEMLDQRNSSLGITSHLLIPFWEMLQRDVEEQCYINPVPIGRPFGEREKQQGFEAELLHYIQTHLNLPLTLENASRAFYLSRTQFVRKMRQETGKTFIQFLTDYRLAEAKVLLRDSDWTADAIAGFLGFNSSSYFYTIFRRNTHKTPLEYRDWARRK